MGSALEAIDRCSLAASSALEDYEPFASIAASVRVIANADRNSKHFHLQQMNLSHYSNLHSFMAIH